MNVKRLIFSFSAIAIVAAAIIGGTVAYFSDTEESTENSFSVGTMDLNIDNGNVAVQTINFSDKAPGDVGNGFAVLKNVGNLTGELDIKMGTVANYPCTDGGKNDGTEYCTADAGALGANLEAALYLDVDESGDWSTGDVGLKSDGTTYAGGDLDYDIMNNYSGKSWDAVATAMATNDEYKFALDWKVPVTAGNEIQGDVLKFDISFILEQSGQD